MCDLDWNSRQWLKEYLGDTEQEPITLVLGEWKPEEVGADPRNSIEGQQRRLR